MADSFLKTIGERVEGLGERVEELSENVQDWTDDFFSDIGENRKKQALLVAAALLILLAAFWLLGQYGNRATLRITDAQGNPLGDATVRLYDANGHMVASGRTANGTISFDSLPCQDYRYVISATGHDDLTGTYNPCTSDGTIHLPAGPAAYVPPSRAVPRPPEQQFSDYVPPRTDAATPTPGPAYATDATLKITVNDAQGGKGIGGATVTLKDGTTGIFIAQGQTDAQGILTAGVRKGSSVHVQAVAANYGPAPGKSVAITAASQSIQIALSSLASGQSQATHVNVQNSSQQPVAGARVQAYQSGQQPLIDQAADATGVAAFQLPSDAPYNLRVSKETYDESVQTLHAGDNRTVTLTKTPESSIKSSLTVQVQDNTGQPAANAQVGLFKQIGTDFIPYAGQAADATGNAAFDGLQAGWTVLANATDASGTAAASAQITLVAGANTLTVHLPAATALPLGAKSYTLCRQPPGNDTFTANGYEYIFKDLNADSNAAFQVAKGQAIVCTTHTPDCIYALSGPTAANAALAQVTGVTVQLQSVDTLHQCIDVRAITACTGDACLPAACPAIYMPVCGANGVSYANDCEAKNAHMQYVSGQCTDQCTDQYDPVCAENGVTYTNACLAIRDGQTYQGGTCPIPSDAIAIAVPAGVSLIAPPGTGAFAATNCTLQNRYLFSGFDTASQTAFSVKPSTGATTDMAYTNGYWVTSQNACVVYWKKPAQSVEYKKTLQPGMNAIGAPDTPATLNQIIGNCQNVALYEYWGAQNKDDTQRTPVPLDAPLQPGHGYWAYYDAAAGSTCTLVPTTRLNPTELVSRQYFKFPFSASSLCASAPQDESQSIICQAAWDEKCGVLGYLGGVSNSWDATGMSGFCFRKGAPYLDETWSPTATSGSQPQPQDVITRKRYDFPYSATIQCPAAPQNFNQRSLCIAAYDEKCGVLGYLGGSAIDWDSTGQEGFCYRAGAAYANENLPASGPTSNPKPSDIITRYRFSFPLRLISQPNAAGCNAPANYIDYYTCQTAFDENCASKGFIGGTPNDWDATGIEGFCYNNPSKPTSTSGAFAVWTGTPRPVSFTQGNAICNTGEAWCGVDSTNQNILCCTLAAGITINGGSALHSGQNPALGPVCASDQYGGGYFYKLDPTGTLSCMMQVSNPWTTSRIMSSSSWTCNTDEVVCNYDNTYCDPRSSCGMNTGGQTTSGQGNCCRVPAPPGATPTTTSRTQICGTHGGTCVIGHTCPAGTTSDPDTTANLACGDLMQETCCMTLLTPTPRPTCAQLGGACSTTLSQWFGNSNTCDNGGTVIPGTQSFGFPPSDCPQFAIPSQSCCTIPH